MSLVVCRATRRFHSRGACSSSSWQSHCLHVRNVLAMHASYVFPILNAIEIQVIMLSPVFDDFLRSFMYSIRDTEYSDVCSFPHKAVILE